MKIDISKTIYKLKNSSLFKDSFWALFGNALGKGLALIAGIAVARFLGNESYGEYGMIRNNLTMIATFSSLGLGYTATKFIAECKEKSELYNIHKIVTRLTILFSGIIALLVIIFTKPISEWLEAPDLEWLLRFTAIAIVFNAVNTTQVGELAGLKAYKEIAKNNAYSGIVTFVASIVLTFYYSLNGAVLSLVISFVVNCALNKISLSKYIKRQVDVKERLNYKTILSFTFPVALQESSYAITSWGCTIILIKLASYGELGLYSAATQWMAVMMFVPSALRNVALSHLAESNDNISSNKRILIKMAQINFVCTIIPFFVVAILSSWICSWYGSSYNGLQSVLNICMFTTVVNSLTNVFTQNLIALNQNWYLFVSRFMRDVFTLVCAYWLISIGGKGAFTLAVVTLVFQSGYLLLLISKQIKMYKKI